MIPPALRSRTVGWGVVVAVALVVAIVLVTWKATSPLLFLLFPLLVLGVLALTAIGIPSVREDALLRPRLLHVIKDGLSRRLILVAAEAGYGETTVMAQWSGACPRSLPSRPRLR